MHTGANQIRSVSQKLWLNEFNIIYPLYHPLRFTYSVGAISSLAHPFATVILSALFYPRSVIRQAASRIYAVRISRKPFIVGYRVVRDRVLPEGALTRRERHDAGSEGKVAAARQGCRARRAQGEELGENSDIRRHHADLSATSLP